jgi:uncharacterized membrane protein
MEENYKSETSLGIDENIEGLLCYLLGWITGIAFLILEKSSRFVRFHAMQSLAAFGSITVASIFLGAIPYLGRLISVLLWLTGLLLWIILMIKALKGEWFKLPIAGDFAERFVGGEQGGIQYKAGHFCSQCGSEIGLENRFCGQCGTKLDVEEDRPARPETAAGAVNIAASPKESILSAVEQELSKYPELSVSRSDKTDMEIKSVLADANWGVGKKKVEYTACLLVKETEHTAVFWEMIKETGSGMDIGGGFKTRSFKSGKSIFGKVKEVQYGPGGKVIDYTWDYGKTRLIVEQVINNNGWKFKTVLMKSKAMY